jgi:hypothetical protein
MSQYLIENVCMYIYIYIYISLFRLKKTESGQNVRGSDVWESCRSIPSPEYFLSYFL